MTTSRYLTRAEVRELAGAHALDRVKRALNAERWPYSIGADGWPRILREYFDSRMRGMVTPTCTPLNEATEPSWG